MKINIAKAVQNEEIILVDANISMTDFSFNGNMLEFLSPFSVKGKIENISGTVILDANACVTFKTQCARCADDVTVDNYSFPLYQQYSQRDTKDDDVIVLSSYDIDLSDILEQQFCMSLPINILCSDDCKGLCEKCGANLNVSQCDCEDDEINPAMAALKDFFK